MVKDILTVCIGDISFYFSTSTNELKLSLEPIYKGFTAIKTIENDKKIYNSISSNLKFSINKSQLPELSNYNLIFDSGSIWKLYKIKNNYYYSFSLPKVSLIIILPQFERRGGNFIVSGEVKQFFPLTYPVGEITYNHYLPLFDSILMHSCGIAINGCGILFPGVSGSGKSTIAKLASQKKDIIVLSDDRIIIKKQKNSFSMYGTPWHGDATFSLNNFFPLKVILYLNHGKYNKLKSLTPSQGASLLLARAFLHFWDKRRLDMDMALAVKISTLIPSFLLEFTPDIKIFDFIMIELEKQKNIKF